MTGAKRKEGPFREEEGVETEEGDKIAIWVTEKATKNQVLTIYQNPIMYLILSINIICSFNDFFLIWADGTPSKNKRLSN